MKAESGAENILPEERPRFKSNFTHEQKPELLTKMERMENRPQGQPFPQKERRIQTTQAQAPGENRAAGRPLQNMRKEFQQQEGPRQERRPQIQPVGKTRQSSGEARPQTERKQRGPR